MAEASGTFKDVADWAESGHIDIKPDMVMYFDDIEDAVNAYSIPPENEQTPSERRSKISPKRMPYRGRCAWAWMKLFIEVKRTERTSGFKFTSPGFLNDGIDAELSRAQIAKYSSEIQLRQHRTHLFSLFICGMYARILRWDRTGAIVSEVIDLKKDWKVLYTFIYRFSKMSPSKQGYDTTAELATEDEIKKLRAYSSPNPSLMSFRDHMLYDLEGYPVYKVSFCIASH